MTTKKINPFKANKHEIYYNLINCFLAGALVFFGSLSNGSLTFKGFCFSLLAFGIVFLTKFKNYWDGEKREYSNNLFNFIGV